MVFNYTTSLTEEHGDQSRLHEMEVITGAANYSIAGKTKISGVTCLVYKAKKQRTELAT